MTVNERIEAWFAGREDEYVSALAPLIAIDSTTGTPEPGKPFGPGPAMALDAALELARKWGLTTGEDEGYVGTVDLNDQPDQLHILAHLDVVGIGDGWDTDPFTLVRNGDLIYGRGTDDDKGPAVAAMMAMRCVKELGLPLGKYHAYEELHALDPSITPEEAAGMTMRELRDRIDACQDGDEEESYGGGDGQHQHGGRWNQHE